MLLCCILWDSGHYIAIAIFSMLSLSHSLLAFTGVVSENLQWPDCTLSQLYLQLVNSSFEGTIVHWLVDLIGYSTITSFHSSIYLVSYLWIAIISLYYFNRYSTPYTLRKCSTLSHLWLVQVLSFNCTRDRYHVNPVTYLCYQFKTKQVVIKCSASVDVKFSVICCPSAAQTRLIIRRHVSGPM